MYDPRDTCLLDEALARYEELVNSPYLYELTHFPVCPSTPTSSCIGFIQIEGFPTSTTYGTFSYVLNALASLNITIGYSLQVIKEQLFIYIGIKGQQYYDAALELLRTGLTQTFPGIQITQLTAEQSCQLLEQLFNPSQYCSVGTISVIPDTPSKPILTTFDTLMGKTSDYVLFLLVNPVSPCNIRLILNELISLYDIFSGFTQGNHGMTTGLSKNTSTTIVRTTTETNGTSSTETHSSGDANNASAYTNITPSTSLPLPDNRALNISILCNKTNGHSYTTGLSMANGCTASEAISQAAHNQRATNHTNNESLTVVIQNKYVIDAIARLNTLISRYTNLLSLPAFEFGAYLLAPKLATTTRGAYTYLGSSNASPTISPMVVNLWDACHSDFYNVLKTLQNFNQPTFKSCLAEECVSSTTIISGIEFTNTLYFT